MNYAHIFISFFLAIFITTSQSSDKTSYAPPKSVEQLINNLNAERDVQYTGNRWETIVSVCNYTSRMELLETVSTLFKRYGFSNDHIHLALEDIYMQARQEIADKEKLENEPSKAMKTIVQQALKTTYNPIPFKILTGTIQDLDVSPAAICKNHDGQAILLLHPANETSSQLLGNMPYAFDCLPITMQEAIIHHEFAHIPTWEIDTLILRLTGVCLYTQPELQESIYNKLESCVDATAIIRSHHPLKTAAGLYDFLKLHKSIGTTYRMQAIEEIQDGFAQEPLARAKKLFNASRPPMTQAFSKLVAALKRLPK